MQQERQDGLAYIQYVFLLWGKSDYKGPLDGFWVPSSLPSHEADKLVKIDSTRVQSHEKGELQLCRCGDAA